MPNLALSLFSSGLAVPHEVLHIAHLGMLVLELQALLEPINHL